MRKLKLAVWTLSIVVVSCREKKDNQSAHQGERADSLKLTQLTSYAWSHWIDSTTSPYITSKVYKDFDFYRFAPLDSVNADFKITAYYNENDEVVRLCRSSIYKENDFAFRILRNVKPHFTILLPRHFCEEEKKNNQNEPIEGFIIPYKGGCYFVGFPQDPFCVMELDRRLNAVRTLRFCSNKLIYRTKVTYQSDDVYSEILYTPLKPMTITNETLFTDVVKLFGKNIDFRYEREMKVGWLEEWGGMPLWDDAGRHAYDTQLTPSYQELPRPELLYNCLRKPLEK